MDYKRTPEWWQMHRNMSGEALARDHGGDGAHWRRAKRKAVPEPVESTVVRRGIAVFDLHHPVHDKRLWSNILRFAEDFDPDIFCFGGDNLDMQTLSHWVRNKRGKVEGMRLKKDYQRFNTDVLDPLDDILRDEAERVFLLGNHEEWLNQYLDENPEMKGLIEMEEHLHLDPWTVLQYGETAKFGKLWATHGTYINLHNAMKTAQVFGRNIMYGHGHTLQVHTITTPLDVESHIGVQIPCACHTNPDYRRNQPNGWLNGLAAFYIQSNGNFNLYPIIASDGAFTAPTGVTYE